VSKIVPTLYRTHKVFPIRCTNQKHPSVKKQIYTFQ